MGSQIYSRLLALNSQSLRRCHCLRRATVRTNVYLPKQFQRLAHSVTPISKGRYDLAHSLGRRLAESRLSPSFNQNDYNLAPTHRLFVSSSDQSPPGQEQLLEADSDPDTAHSPTISLQESPDDFDYDMVALQPEIGPQGLPPLPNIANKETHVRVFTHRSYYARPSNVFEDLPIDPSPDNEVLEHLGDSVLSLMITSLINERYPHLRVGPATKIRAMVVGNKTLSGISVNYKLPGNLRLHHAQAASLKASVKVQADVFEAYVGGVYLDRGIEVARSWIYALFEPYIREAYRIVREQHGLPPPLESTLPSPVSPDIAYSGVWDPSSYASRHSSTSGTSDEDTPPLGRASTANSQATGHLALLNQRIQQLHKSVEWSYSKEPGPGTRTTPRWKAVCIVGDRPIAEGLGTTKKAAQNAAAKDGLMNLGVSVD